MSTSSKKLLAFANAFALLCQVYRRTPSHALTELYWKALSTYPIEAIDEAFSLHVSDKENGRFFPTPAHVLKQLHRHENAQAQLAWQQVIRAIHHHGRYGGVQFDDPMIVAALRELGGWTKLCNSLESELPYYQRRFCACYCDFVKDPLSLPKAKQRRHLGADMRFNGVVPMFEQVKELSESIKAKQSANNRNDDNQGG